MSDIIIPEWLVDMCSGGEKTEDWLADLPAVIADLKDRWSFEFDSPFEREPGPSWVAPVIRQDGTRAVLKLGMPHMEAEHEIDALRFLDGNPTAHLFEFDRTANAILLERCEPGTILRDLPEEEQDKIIAQLLPKIWRVPPPEYPFRSLSLMIEYWIEEALEEEEQWTDRALVQEAIALYRELVGSTEESVLLATDLHAANVLRAQREPWLVIDLKPFVGDRTYDATQHLLNCCERLCADPRGTIGGFADLLALDAKRVHLWTFARAVIDSRAKDLTADSLARRLAP